MDELLGIRDEGLEWYQMSLRAVISFFAVIALIRIGNKRFLGKLTSYDIIVAIIIGSIVSRGITGSAPFFATLITAAVLIMVHSGLSYLSFKFDFFNRWIKGKRRCLVDNGKFSEKEMARSRISKDDIMNAARKEGIRDSEAIDYAYLENNGNISIITKQQDASNSQGTAK